MAAHPYLVATLAGTALAALAWAFAGPQRGPMLWAGAMEAIHAPFSPLFGQVYWSPGRLGGQIFGIEDILVCVMLGAGVWFAAALPWRDRLRAPADRDGALLRFVILVLVPIPVGMGLRYGLNLTVMESLIVGMLGLTAVLLALRPDLWRLSVAGVLIYLPYYLVFMALCLALIPGFAAVWDGPELWGPRLLGVPVDELAWATAFAACYPAVVATVLDLRFGPPGAAPRGQ